MDSISLRGDSVHQLASVSIVLSHKQETADKKQEVKALPAADLHRLHVKVRPQDVDVGVQVEGSGRLTLPRLPHLNAPHRSEVRLIDQSEQQEPCQVSGFTSE